MIRYFVFLGMLLASSSVLAQQKYWIFFKDSYRSTQPALSPRSLQRRMEQKIPLTVSDFPLNSDYLNSLKNNGIEPLRVSRWLNAISAYLSPSQLQQLASFDFVVEVKPVVKWKFQKPKPSSEAKTANYGFSATQIQMLNLPYLHQQGYKGSGKIIGVFDSGFIGANTHRAFTHLFQSNRVLHTYNFVTNSTDVYNMDSHGTSVWSCIGGLITDTLVGTATDASFILAVTEDVGGETTVEEDNWLAAMEWADSLGVEIINTSLGYTEMTNIAGYTYADMNGDNTIISRAADIAASKGILVVVAAGNEGNNPWQKISAPCDADSVLCVGSVSALKIRSSFSSMGPTSDGRIKPDVMAMGGNTFIATPTDVNYGSGTSFASPVMCGAATCLWQANPSASNMQIIDAIRQSGDRASNPDTLYGWGIPNLAKADSILKGLTNNEKDFDSFLHIFPNPAKNHLFIKTNLFPIQQITIMDAQGRIVFTAHQLPYEIPVHSWADGLYFITIQSPANLLHAKFVISSE